MWLLGFPKPHSILFCSYCDGGSKSKKCEKKPIGELDPIRWQHWQPWTGCTECGVGNRTRWRVCNKTCHHDTRICEPDPVSHAMDKEQQPCPTNLCDRDCEYEEKRSECSAVCNNKDAIVNGTITVTIIVTAKPKNQGKACPNETKEPCSKKCEGMFPKVCSYIFLINFKFALLYFKRILYGTHTRSIFSS